MYLVCVFFFFNDTATTEIYTLSLHDALPIWQQRQREKDECVPEHLSLGLSLAPDERCHGNAGLAIVALLEERERPEVGRRPVKDDQEEIDRGEVDLPSHRGPAHERRKGAGRSADHDVLRRRALQPARVDEDV